MNRWITVCLIAVAGVAGYALRADNTQSAAPLPISPKPGATRPEAVADPRVDALLREVEKLQRLVAEQSASNRERVIETPENPETVDTIFRDESTAASEKSRENLRAAIRLLDASALAPDRLDSGECRGQVCAIRMRLSTETSSHDFVERVQRVLSTDDLACGYQIVISRDRGDETTIYLEC